MKKIPYLLFALFFVFGILPAKMLAADEMPLMLREIPANEMPTMVGERPANDAHEPYRSTILVDRVKSLQIYNHRSWDANPVIALSGEEQIHIAFDELSHDYKRYAYRIIHCDADWTSSSMNELEYMEGFSENDIRDYATSQGTFQDYTHYDLLLPNDDVRLKISGNYVAEIYDRDEDNRPVLTACFSVTDLSVGIEAQVNTTTDYANNQSFQQVEFDLKTAACPIDRPESDLKILVRQNRRTDNQVYGVQPLMVGANVIHYQHRENLIFAAGNEYRRCEFSTFKYAGMGVDKMVFERPFYHAYLLDADPRILGYTYEEDQNGRFYIHSLQAIDDDQTEADYFWVHFRLPMPRPLAQKLYIFGDMTENSLQPSAEMIYNESEKAYEQQLFLKQGIYNYLYVTPQKSSSVSLSQLEGNYWATENEYQIFVYYRPMGAQYDALVGYTEIICRPSVR